MQQKKETRQNPSKLELKYNDDAINTKKSSKHHITQKYAKQNTQNQKIKNTPNENYKKTPLKDKVNNKLKTKQKIKTH